MKKISFDFDNTIAMSYLTFDAEEPIPIFQSYNDNIIAKIKKHIEDGDSIYIVTARTKALEPRFPEQNIESHLEKLGLKEYFWPDRVIYTNAGPKNEILRDLGVEKHYDDSIEEHYDALDGDYSIIQPLDDLEDSNVVGKVAIYDQSGRILILQRSDEGHLWDLPGGHIKNIEVARGEQGYEDGTDREVFEETGLLLPFLKEFMVYDFVHRGISHKIHMYLSQLEGVTPDIRLDLQEIVENIDYKWVTLEELEGYMGKTTTNLRKMYDELNVKEEIFEKNEPYQLKMKKKRWNGKKKLIGLGKNKSFGGGKGWTRPSMARSKSAPAGFGVLEEENDEKKVKIKVKIVKKEAIDDIDTPNLDEKRKKRRKKRKKKRKNRGIGSYWPYNGLQDSGDFGDSGGDGGE